jgi:replicative DNA helicase
VREIAETDGDPYIPTGLPSLDDLLVGLFPDELTIIAGNPGEGKSSLGLQVAEYAAVNGVPVGIFSLEMSKMALAMRLASTKSGVDMRRLRGRLADPLTKAEKAAITEASQFYAELPMFVDDSSLTTGQVVYDNVPVWVQKLGVQLVVIDHLTHMPSLAENRVNETGQNAKMIRAACKEARIPFLLLTQCNRAQSLRENKRPRMSDLRDSGEIEQVADNILMFHYPEDDASDDVRVCDIHVIKHRNGQTGIASVRFDRKHTRFTE